MTKTGPSRPVDDGFAEGRLDNARAFLEAAEVAATLADPGDNANPIVSHIVSSVIAYTDALTARYGTVGVSTRKIMARQSKRCATRSATACRAPRKIASAAF